MASIAAFEGFENKETQKAAQCGEKGEIFQQFSIENTVKALIVVHRDKQSLVYTLNVTLLVVKQLS